MLVALTHGLGFTMLLPLLRVSQSSTNPEELGSAERVLFDLLSWMGIAGSMVWILGFIALIFLAKGMLKFAQGSYIGYLQADLLRELKMRLFDEYNRMTYRYYIGQNTGHFINVINQQVNRFFQSFSKFSRALTRIVSALSFFAYAFAITWKFALTVLLVGIGLLALFKYLNAYVRRLSRRISKEMSRLNKFLVQSLKAFKYVVSTGQTDRMRTGVTDSVRRLTGDIFRQRIAGALTDSVREPISVLVVTAVIAFQVAVLNEPVTPIFVALLLFHKGMQSMMAVQSQWQKTMDMIGSAEVVDEEIQRVQKNKESTGTRTLGPLHEGIEFRNVCYAYNDGDGDVLHDVSVSIPANTTIAFVGKSGAGKSTLIDMISLMLKPRTGTIEIDGIPNNEVDVASWRNQIGYVSQDTVIFDDSVAKNIHLWQGDIEEDPELRERVIDAARRAHAHEFIKGLPDGYQTMVGEEGMRLSGGQRQRLFVARELFKQPELLLLDEATSDLDTASEQHIQDSLETLQGEVTVVIIAHRLSTVKSADHIYVLEDGRIIESGGYNELRSMKNGSFRKMVEMQRL